MSSQHSPSNRATKRRLPRVEDFIIGWICALPIELDAARQALDEEFDRIRDIPNYFLGRIGGHNIAIGCLSRYGTNAAASTVTDMVSTFPQLKYGLLVGIAGGVPKYLNQGVHTDIHLGDVVVGYPQGCYPGVVQYDFGKTGPDGKQSLNGSLNSPPENLIKAVSMMRSNFNLGKRKLRAKIFLDGVGTVVPYQRQPDVLYDASYRHVDGDSCGNCNREKVIRCGSRESDEIIVHYGLVASGNQVMRDGLTRDRLSQDHNGILCFEMEAAGIVNSLPCLVVRGICDYADSHKNKQWQSFAAAAAASCAREVLSYIKPAGTAQGTGPLAEISFSTSATPVNSLDQTTGFDSHIHISLTDGQKKRYLESLTFEQMDSRRSALTGKWVVTQGF
jgi:nucleoside phosphorylase